jgi:hypothetical protein
LFDVALCSLLDADDVSEESTAAIFSKKEGGKKLSRKETELLAACFLLIALFTLSL